jgi:hypothetical protein
MGAYFIAKGLWMARSLHLQDVTADATRLMVEWREYDHEQTESEEAAVADARG